MRILLFAMLLFVVGCNQVSGADDIHFVDKEKNTDDDEDAGDTQEKEKDGGKLNPDG